MSQEPMTQERLNDIRARADGATSGPWGCYGDGAHEVFDAGEYSDGDHGEVVAAVIDKLSDAVFIAEAREDIPALLAEVHRLRAELAKVREVTEETVERSARALAAHWTDRHTNESLGRQKVLARHALHAALGGGDDA